MTFYTPYSLNGAWTRKGALIRIESEGSFGYADLHPWPELGDEPLEFQLKNLGKTALSKEALKHARLDAAGRQNRVNLLEGLKIPQSHFLVTGESIPDGWPSYKLKLEKIDLLTKIPAGAKVRLDCNGKLSVGEAEKLLKTLNPLQVEFVEDPCPYNAEDWIRLSKIGIPLAADRYKTDEAAVAIIKPAIEDVSPYFLNPRKLVVTSYLGHPLGQVIAAYYAGMLSRLREVSLCGLLSHHAYEPNKYSARLPQNGPTFTIPAGIGFGFDDLLELEDWHALRMEF